MRTGWFAGLVACSLLGSAAAAPPTLVRGSATALPGTPVMHVARLADQWGVRPTALPQLVSRGEVAIRGGTVTRLAQVIDGLPVEGGELRVLTRGLDLLAVSGTLLGADTPRTAVAFTDDEVGAIARAVRSIYRAPFSGDTLRPSGALWGGDDGTIAVVMARAWQAWHQVDGRLVAAWIVETCTTGPMATADEFMRTVLAAADGRVLFQRSVVQDAAASYRVFTRGGSDPRPADAATSDFLPHPTGVPDGSTPVGFITPTLVSIDGLNHPPGGGTDPWLPDGATTTSGNNADAFADRREPDGFSAEDLRPTLTGPRTFGHVFDTAQGSMASTTQIMAATVSLFYMVNWLHDFWYDAGFTETAGNGQLSNYGRGGLEGDPLQAHAQDSSLDGARDNANMATFGDGMPSVMQMYVLTGGDRVRTLAFTPAIGAVTRPSPANFGPRTYELSGAVVEVDACAPTVAVSGKIGLGRVPTACSSEDAALRVQMAGGLGLLLYQESPNGLLWPLEDDFSIDGVTIPALHLSNASGLAILAQLGTGPVTATLAREPGPEGDSDLEATVIAHEFGHFLHFRTSGCGNVYECYGVSEGWGDFLALLFSVDDGDPLDAAYPLGFNFHFDVIPDRGYFGIRRYPYSTDRTIDPRSFRHMSDDQPLPAGIPSSPLGAPNSEVHNAGEVWASTMWEVFVELRRLHPETPLDELRHQMASWIVGGLLMTPFDGRALESRDAFLLAVAADAPEDALALAGAFARKGMGTCAVDAPRDSSDLNGIVESTTLSGLLVAGVPALLPALSCDADTFLDAGETGQVIVPIANHGPAPLTNVTVSITSSTPGLAFANNTVTIESVPAFGSVDATVDVTLADGTPSSDATIAVAIQAPGACEESASLVLSAPLEGDVQANVSATETFDAPSIWTEQDDPEVWAQEVDAGRDLHYHGQNDQVLFSDASVASPPLVASPTAPVVMTLQHHYDLEGDEFTLLEGGLIEVSTDGGATWQDAQDFASVPYTGSLPSVGGPLDGRAAFGGRSPSFPAPQTLRVNFGTSLAGETFQVRFRMGALFGSSAQGWFIDDIAFAGLTNTPFSNLVADATECEPTDDTTDDMTDDGDSDGSDDGGCCQSNSASSSLLLGLGLLLLSRRSRRARSR